MIRHPLSTSQFNLDNSAGDDGVRLIVATVHYREEQKLFACAVQIDGEAYCIQAEVRPSSSAQRETDPRIIYRPKTSVM